MLYAEFSGEGSSSCRDPQLHIQIVIYIYNTHEMDEWEDPEDELRVD